MRFQWCTHHPVDNNIWFLDTRIAIFIAHKLNIRIDTSRWGGDLVKRSFSSETKPKLTFVCRANTHADWFELTYIYMLPAIIWPVRNNGQASVNVMGVPIDVDWYIYMFKYLNMKFFMLAMLVFIVQ